MSSDETDEEEFTLKPLRKSMISLYEELTKTVERLNAIQKQVETPAYKDLLESLLPKALESGVKGPAIYDFILSNIALHKE
jgi:hypothetical protein